MKVYDYIIECKRPNYKWVDLISQLMLLMAISVFTFSLSVAVMNTRAILILFLIAGMSLWWVYTFNKQKKGNIPFYRTALSLATIGWVLQPQGLWIALIYFLAVISEKQVKFPIEIAFDEEEIVFNSFPKKYYYWSDLSNVILKDGMLTIDFHSNKLIQKEIETHTSIKTEQEFNEFCINRLKAESEKS